jgi:predicted site-specific integrase-resolvase
MNPKRKLVPAPKARTEYLGGISAMTEYRWRKAGVLPHPIQIRKRNYYREADLIAVQQRFAAGSEGGAAA